MTAATDIHDLASERISRKIAKLSDDDLVMSMVVLLSAGEDVPMLGGVNEVCAQHARCVFSEIARRWIPPSVFGAAFGDLDREES